MDRKKRESEKLYDYTENDMEKEIQLKQVVQNFVTTKYMVL